LALSVRKGFQLGIGAVFFLWPARWLKLSPTPKTNRVLGMKLLTLNPKSISLAATARWPKLSPTFKTNRGAGMKLLTLNPNSISLTATAKSPLMSLGLPRL
jgi:hypothetical protein